jgi:hypothetical protein
MILSKVKIVRTTKTRLLVDKDDTQTTESDDMEEDDEGDALMTCIPELVHQIGNSDSSDTDVDAGIRQLTALAQDEDNC